MPTTATADESARKPAPGTERLWIVLSVAEETLPHRDAHPGMRALREDDGAADAAPPRNRGFLDIGARRRRPGRPQPAAGAPSSRRDDLIALLID